MEGFDLDDNVINAGKSRSMLRFYGLREIKTLLRVTEIFLLLVFLAWASRRLPFAARISGVYLRQLVKVVLSHLFVFFLGNIIVLFLFFKSRSLFLQSDSQDVSEATAGFCLEFIENNYNSSHLGGEIRRQPEEIVFQDKQTILEVTKVRVHRRCRSVNLRREKSLEEDRNCEGCGKQLRRSETERKRRVEEVAVENAEVVDELSNEEFQRAIEAFIAKQVKFHQEEKLAIVVHGCN